ncbi:hypothetical protein JVX91_23125 [Pseudomonas sp. PDNC002]|uniref:hypothetical protein n=1 Tax=Pseudomonas sp. PDNC002 TaxID=2811422 RepID=UPI00196310A6|nr:hypothetical protein [Pseudomonas sp. PDNC002]QRY78449.1 hypothetical protein JVX91_23125 [Pseudomonas sp. PDNC002]
MKVRVLLLCVALAGCSSPGKLKEEAPAVRLQSTQSPSVYMACLLPRWQSYRPSAAVREIRLGYRLIMPAAAGDSAQALVEVTATDKGSDVTLYRRDSPVPDDAITAAVRSCL